MPVWKFPITLSSFHGVQMNNQVRYVCEACNLSVWQLFTIAYAHKYQVFSVVNHDIEKFRFYNNEVPEYVQEFIDTVAPKKEEPKVDEAPFDPSWEGWEQRT
jgi:hypothetical protein